MPAVVPAGTPKHLSMRDPEALRLLMLLEEQGAHIRMFESTRQSFHLKAYALTDFRFQLKELHPRNEDSGLAIVDAYLHAFFSVAARLILMTISSAFSRLLLEVSGRRLISAADMSFRKLTKLSMRPMASSVLRLIRLL